MKKAFLVLLILCALSSSSEAQSTWTYVQESVITYCANNTSSCSNFAGTMIPTLSNSVWIFGISTTNDVTATVSGGGATWTECANCTTFLSGFRRNRVFYAFGGTAGSTGFTITLSGSSGSAFAVTFVEVLPPSGSTASFDVGGATSSSTCSGTCTGVGLTLAATDVVVQFMNRIAPADYKGWPVPYLTLPNGDGIHLNALSGNESAPVVNVAAGTGAVFSAIAFKSSLGSFTPPAVGPISLVQFVDPDPASGLTGLNCSPSCNLTVNSTGAGHLLYLEAANVSGTFLSSVSGGGTWTVPVSCQIKGGQSANNSLSCAYVLSSTASATSISITMNGNGSTQFAFYEVATSVGTFTFDAVGTATNAASSNPSGVSLNLAAGGNDIVFQSISVFGGTSSLSYYPFIRGCRSGCGPQFYNGQAASDAIMNVAGGAAAPVPQFSNQQNNSTVVSGVAFKASVPTINAATCNATDVQTALNSVAADGTTVVLPVCPPSSNIQWSGTGPAVSYNQTFSTVLQGQGSVATSNADGNPATYNDQTAICDLVSNSSNATFQITTAANKTFRMTGISFVNNCSQATARNTGVINIRGDSHSFRMDHNHFTSPTGPRMLNIASGDVWGVLDHNLFDAASGITVNYVEVNGANYNGSGDSFGDASWTDVENFGTGNFLFAENNTFTSTTSTGTRSFDVQQGGRFVFRHNTNINSSLQTHAIGHDGPTFRDRGPRAFEVYQNSFTWPNGGAPFAFGTDYEGGTSLYWGNTVASGTFQTWVNIDYRRATGFTYAQIAPPNGWGYCGSLQTGGNGPGPSVWDQNMDTSGRGCLDGVGRGKGDSITGNTWPNVNNAVTGTQVWARQALAPMYVWANTTPGVTTYVNSVQAEQDAVLNRDFYAELPNPTNGATFNGTVGIGNGTLTPSTSGAYTNAPACTNGVAYWQSTTQTLFQCQAAWGTVDELFQFANGTVGNTVTTATLAAGGVGPAVSWALNPATPTGFTFAVSQGNMGGSVTVGSTTFPFGTPTEAIALNDANNFTYGTGSVSSNQKQVVANGFITFGAANAGVSGLNWDLVLLNDTNSSAAVILQLNNGQPCYCVRIETNGTNGVQRSSNITITPGNRYSFSLLLDENGGQAKLAIFDPSNGFAQVGSTVQVIQNTGFNFTSMRFGNAEAGTSTGTTYFENLMLDWTNHTFPRTPTTSWVSFYQPFTYPHPLLNQAAPSTFVSPAPVAFANQAVGTASPSVTIVLSNTGSSTLSLTSITVSGTNASDFSISGTGTTCPLGAGTLNAGLSCNVILVFNPPVAGSRSASLNIVSNSSTSPDVDNLSGAGVTVIQVTGTGTISGTGTIHD